MKGDYHRHTCAQLVKITIIITAIEVVAFCIGYQANFGFTTCVIFMLMLFDLLQGQLFCAILSKETKVTKTWIGKDEEA